MKTKDLNQLFEKLDSHFKNLDQEKFDKDWHEISKISVSEGISIDEFLDYQYEYKYMESDYFPEKDNINFNNLLENPSFTSDFLFIHNGTRCI
ncbi:hypothetical protein [Flagellimonas sp.]|uniref:hypothetical protein n=1 Tax=Flagellimonas sp. TaxID=2058762 RepID=UPI003BA9CA15